MKNKYSEEDYQVVVNGNDVKHAPAKRVDIVRVNLVKESSLLYKNRRIANLRDAYELFKQFLG